MKTCIYCGRVFDEDDCGDPGLYACPSCVSMMWDMVYPFVGQDFDISEVIHDSQEK